MAGIENRFTLNGVVLTDQPFRWLDTDEIIRREETFGSLISEVAGEIKFIRKGLSIVSTEGWNVINTAIGVNPCANLTFLVERKDKSGFFETEYDGLVPLIGIQQDDDTSTFTVTPIVNDSAAKIQTNQNAPYFFSDTKSLDGSTAITNAFGNRKITTLQDPESIEPDETTKITYAISDVLQAQLDYMTNGAVTLESDLFKTDTQQTVIRDIEFTGLVNGEVITVNFTFFSGSYTLVQAHSTGTSFILATAINEFLKVKSGINGQENYTENKNGDITTINSFQTNASNTDPIIRIESVNNFTIDSVTTDLAATVVLVDVQEAEYGMKNLTFATGNNLLELTASLDTIPPSISFRNLLENLNKTLHISFRLIKSGGVETFKIERAQDFFAATSSITLNRVNDLKRTIISQNNLSTCIPGDGHTVELSDEINESTSYKSQDCNTQTIDLTTTFIVDPNTLWNNAAGTTGFDNNGLEDFYFLMVEDITVSPVISERISYSDTTSFKTTFPPTYRPYNAYLTNFQKIKNNFFRLADNIGNGDSRLDANANARTILISNTATPQILYFTEFSKAISFADFQLIKNGQIEKITYNTDGLTNKVGWIQEVRYKKKSGFANFILLTEN